MKSDPVMPFGRYKGERLEDVPKSYLRWLKKNCELYGWLEIAVKAVLKGKPIPPTDEEREAEADRITKPFTPSPGEPPPW